MLAEEGALPRARMVREVVERADQAGRVDEDEHAEEQPELPAAGHEQDDPEREHPVLEELRGSDEGCAAGGGRRDQEPDAECRAGSGDRACRTGKGAPVEQPQDAEEGERGEREVGGDERDRVAGGMNRDLGLVDRSHQAEPEGDAEHQEGNIAPRQPRLFVPEAGHGRRL